MLRLSRLPVRVRVTLAFAGMMALVLAATGLFLYLRLGAELDTTIEQGLRSRAGDVTALVKQADLGLAQSGRSPLTERGENLAQILDTSGRVVDSTPSPGNRPVLTDFEVRRAMGGTVLLDKERIAGEDEPARLLATPVRAQDQRLVVVVGTTLDGRRAALRNLGGLLLIGGPVALLLASLAGYAAAGAALNPVERMRRRAAVIQDAAPGQRLPVPPADDEIGRLGQTLNDMLGRLEAAFERERTFVSDASHELRTPLAILKGELEIALRPERTAQEREEGCAPPPRRAIGSCSWRRICWSSPDPTRVGCPSATPRLGPLTCWTSCASASSAERTSRAPSCGSPSRMSFASWPTLSGCNRHSGTWSTTRCATEASTSS